MADDDESPNHKSPEKNVDKEMTSSTKASKKTSKVRKKKTSDGSTAEKPKKSTSRKKSTKKESTKTAAAASSEDDLEDVYRSEANLIRGNLVLIDYFYFYYTVGSR